MSKGQEEKREGLEVLFRGLFGGESVVVSEKESMDDLSSRGYGVSENNKLKLELYEALFLMDKGLLEVKDADDERVSFQLLLQSYEAVDENAWVKYLSYRDLRSRGYVVREGFGIGVDFRVYDRGEYSKDAAKYLVLSVQEGKPLSLEDLTRALKQSLSLKKELVLSVMNRRGETVYYSVSQLTLP